MSATTEDHLYRVRFINQDKVFEIYARSVYQGDLYGFVVLEELVFDPHSKANHFADARDCAHRCGRAQGQCSHYRV